MVNTCSPCSWFASFQLNQVFCLLFYSCSCFLLCFVKEWGKMGICGWQMQTIALRMDEQGPPVQLLMPLLFSPQSCPALCHPRDCSPPGSSVHGRTSSSVQYSSQARILEWAAISFSRGSSQPRDRIQVSCLSGDSLPLNHLGSPLYNTGSYILSPGGKLNMEKNFLKNKCIYV